MMLGRSLCTFIHPDLSEQPEVAASVRPPQCGVYFHHHFHPTSLLYLCNSPHHHPWHANLCPSNVKAKATCALVQQAKKLMTVLPIVSSVFSEAFYCPLTSLQMLICLQKTSLLTVNGRCLCGAKHSRKWQCLIQVRRFNGQTPRFLTRCWSSSQLNFCQGSWQDIIKWTLCCVYLIIHQLAFFIYTIYLDPITLYLGSTPIKLDPTT